MANYHKIVNVEADSIGSELGIEPGDLLISINNQEIEDIFDYRYLINDEYITVLIRKPDGEEWELEIEKEFEEDLGIDFEYHTSQQHNIDNYFSYLLKSLKTDEHDLNSIDFQVLNAFKQNKIEFFPIKKAKSLESGN